MFYYQKNPGDYMSDAGHLSLLEHGVYNRLLDIAYATEAPLPLDLDHVCRKVGARAPAEKKAVLHILEEFFTKTVEGWIQGRVQKEIDAFHAKSKKRADAANQRWNRDPSAASKQCNDDANALQMVCTGDANQEPLTKNHKPTTNSPLAPQGEEAAASSPPKAKGTLDELKAYAVEIGLPASDGEFMFDHWSSNGWKNGSAQSKDWKAGIRKWRQQGWLPSQRGTSHGHKPKHAAYDAATATAGMTGDQIGNLFPDQQ